LSPKRKKGEAAKRKGADSNIYIFCFTILYALFSASNIFNPFLLKTDLLT